MNVHIGYSRNAPVFCYVFITGLILQCE